MLYLDTLGIDEYQEAIRELWAFYARIGIDDDEGVDLWKWKEQYEEMERRLERLQ